MPDHGYFANLIWQIADLLRAPYRPPQYERVMLPMTVLRRFDCVLAPTKAKDGAWCLFKAPVTGSRQGRTVLVRLRDVLDPETGARYTVKRYESGKTSDGDAWHHAAITLRPLNAVFQPIVLTAADEDQVEVVAELVDVVDPA